MATGKVLLGMLAGFAAGAVLGILFAPEKGSRIRKRIFLKGEDAVDDLNDIIEEKIKDLVEIVQTSAVKSVRNDARKTPEYIPV